jgi:Fe2+ or Zn2+ uptake regulation protein
MQPDRDDRVEAVAEAIAGYLRRHTMAADSAEGVARWWLGPAHAGVTTRQVERALELLAERQVVRRVTLTDGSFLYSLAPPPRR